MDYIKTLAKLASRFRGYTAFAAFLVLSFIVLFIWFFSQGSFDPIINGFELLDKNQFFRFVLTVLGLVFLAFILLIFLGYSSYDQKESAVVYVVIHEKGDQSNPISGAEVRLGLPEPIKKISQENGSVNFTISGQDIGKRFEINAEKDGYQKRSPTKVTIGTKSIYLPLEKEKTKKKEVLNKEINSVANNTKVNFYLYISSGKLDMFWSQIPQPTLQKTAKNLNISLDTIDKFSKNVIVSDYINNNMIVGTIENPESYFKGIMQMKTIVLKNGDFSYIYFGGVLNNQHVALVGSTNNILSKPEDIREGGTAHYFINDVIEMFDFYSAEKSITPEKVNLQELDFFVRSLDDEIGYQSQRLEFLAKRLGMCQ